MYTLNWAHRDFSRMRLHATFQTSLKHLRHVEEFIELMNAITNSDRFSRLPELIKERGDGAVLTILFDEAEERGIKNV